MKRTIELHPLTREILDRVQPFTMTGPERIDALVRSVVYLEEQRISGAIVECGVWKGGSMMAAALALRKLASLERPLYLFDTFAGMPPPEDVDVDLYGRPARELLADPSPEMDPVRAFCDLDEVRRNLATTGYDRARIHFIPGRVEDTVPARAPAGIALLRLDTDWYRSTYHELQHLFPRLAKGGVLIVDDYGHWRGAKKAVDVYFAGWESNGAKEVLEWQTIDYTGRMAIKISPPYEGGVGGGRPRATPPSPPFVRGGETKVADTKDPCDRSASRLLNVGCGGRFHPGWINVDLRPQHPSILRHDVQATALPFADGYFEVVYHSHLLEHVPRDRALSLLGDCRRVLGTGGVLRVVVPDLEQIARRYLQALEKTVQGEGGDYDWYVLEMYDQTVRERMGGHMLEYLKRVVLEPQDIAWHRMGADGPIIRRYLSNPASLEVAGSSAASAWDKVRGLLSLKRWRERLVRWLLGAEYPLLQVGRFRRAGEIHHWMYDRVSLGRLLEDAGFAEVRVVQAAESRIPDWPSFHLDTHEDGTATKPDSLYMEAVHPTGSLPARSPSASR